MHRVHAALLAVAVALSCDAGKTATVEPGEAKTSHSAVVVPKIDRDRLSEVVRHLASDELRGRYTLNPADIDRAADFLAAAYESAGIAPVGASYRVPYDVVTGTRPAEDLNVWLEIGADTRALSDSDAVAIANGTGDPVIGDAAIVQMGASLRPLAGKVAVAWAEAMAPDAIVGDVDRLVKAGARGALLVVEEALPDPAPFRAALAQAPIPVALVRVGAFDGRIDPVSAGKASPELRVSLAARREDVTRKAPNVLAYLPGSDLAHEIVIVGAHFDHIGTADNGHFCRTRTLEGGSIDTVCNGADDNASGTAGVLEVARALAEAGYRPRRSLVFAHFSGEELGLYGSGALAEHPPAVPPFSGGKVVAMINMDMIGRLGAAGLSIGGLSSSDGWRAILEAAGTRGLSIVYERAVTSRSDHAHWYRRKVPVLFFFTGLHEDYHGPGDEIDRLNLDGMRDIVAIVLDVTRSVADGAAIAWSEPRSAAEGEVGRLPGSDPATVEPATSADP